MRVHSLFAVGILSVGLLHCSGAADDQDDDESLAESESDLTKDGGADGGKKSKKDGGASTSKKDGGTSSKDKDAGASKDKDAGSSKAKDAGTNVTPPSSPTWTEVYETYFAEGTPGHCGDCHTKGMFNVGSTKTSFYNALVNVQLIDPSNPKDSVLGLEPGSPLAWFGGSMPKDDPSSNSAAKKAITEWLAAGALNN